MATPQADGKYGFFGAPRRFSTTSTPLRRCRRVREELDFLRRWDGDGAAHGAATMLCRVQADFPFRQLRCQSTGT
jgi:hypothetical protein